MRFMIFEIIRYHPIRFWYRKHIMGMLIDTLKRVYLLKTPHRLYCWFLLMATCWTMEMRFSSWFWRFDVAPAISSCLKFEKQKPICTTKTKLIRTENKNNQITNKLKDAIPGNGAKNWYTQKSVFI